MRSSHQLQCRFHRGARERLMMELLTSIRRAGADIILTYYAKDASRLLA